MSNNKITLYSKVYDKDGIQIIEKTGEDIFELAKTLNEWHDELAQIILFPNNLYYFATNNLDSDFYLKELTQENIEDIKIALEVIIKEPNKFYDVYKEKSEYYQKVAEATTIDEVMEILLECGISLKKITGLDIERIKRNAQSKLCMDFCFGIFGEILFYNVVENLLYKKLMLSKVELITAPNTNAHGSDGVFCDENGKILYFGEAKFTVDLDQGISQAVNSMQECLARIQLDKNFMLVHKKDLKNGYGNLISKSNINNYTCSILIFLLHGNEINKNIIVDKIQKSKIKFAKKIGNIEFTVISFPIFSKEHLKESIAKGVDSYGK